MEASSLAFSVAQTILAALQFLELKEIICICGYESRLQKLKDTVTRINAVLQDAQAQEELNQQQSDYVGKLKDAVYDADDLLDEFITRKKQQQQIRDSSKGQVIRLVSSFKKSSLACRMSQEIKKIRQKLEGIASDASKFGFKCDYHQPGLSIVGRKGTCSYVYAESVIGREDDKIKIVDMLLDTNVEGVLPVLSIVGIGGLGKTTLAQLVFNEKRIEKEFPRRMWVCVSDQYQHQWNVNTILANMLKSLTDEKGVDQYGIEQVVKKLRQKLDSSKYLLVLDDMWTEDHGKWLELKDYLLGLGQRGSRIVVTTRSEKTARAVGSNNIHKLKGLSEEDSWRLFESIVSRGQAICNDLMDIGRDILKNCANVPLAIKVIGSLLYDQDKSVWESFQRHRLSEIRKGENDVMTILKFSYHHLSPTLKSCFSYCAMFPKDFVIEKDMLISLWMAQGYLEALDDGQSMDDVGEEYFQILLQRCFFQDIEKDRYGEILSCKMHDLMHDVAQEVAGKEIVVANSTTGSLDPQVRHISFEGDPSDCLNSFISKAPIRTYLQGGDGSYFQFPLSTLLKKWMNLRALHLARIELRSLPNDIGKLLHLRYLDVSQSGLDMLPESLTKLVNLQTLHLRQVDELRELPRNLTRLVKLRVLDIAGCRSLKYMPDGMNRMTGLSTLTMFVVGERDSGMKQRLEDLAALSKLKGSLDIRIHKKFVYKKKEMNSSGEGYISNKKYLNQIDIMWFSDDEDENENANEDEDEDENESANENDEDESANENDEDESSNEDEDEDENKNENEEGGMDNAEDLLEDLQPHSNLKGLGIERYRGTKIPRWGINNNLTTSLPNLVDICISGCLGLQSLPWLGKLQFLKSLYIFSLYNLEYMEDRIFSGNDSSTGSCGAAREVIQQDSSSFFPALESLGLSDLPKLKGWWRGLSSTSGLVMEDDEMTGGESSVQTVGADRLPSFPRLSKLEIYGCPNLMVIPLCPTVETLELDKFSERLRILMKKEEEKREECGSSDSRSSSHDGPKMRVVTTDNARYLKSLPPVAFQCLANLKIEDDSKVESLSEMEVVLRSCSSSLQSIEVYRCSRLKSVSRGLEYLTALESLMLWDLEELRFDETEGEGQGEGEGMPWRRLGQCLRSLTLRELPKVDDLPKGMSSLTALQSLRIDTIPLKDLPEWMRCLSSLQSLEIEYCKHLESLPEALRKLTSLQRFELRACTEIIAKRCQKPNGEDWPKIQHIPCIFISQF